MVVGRYKAQISNRRVSGVVGLDFTPTAAAAVVPLLQRLPKLVLWPLTITLTSTAITVTPTTITATATITITSMTVILQPYLLLLLS